MRFLGWDMAGGLVPARHLPAMLRPPAIARHERAGNARRAGGVSRVRRDIFKGERTVCICCDFTRESFTFIPKTSPFYNL